MLVRITNTTLRKLISMSARLKEFNTVSFAAELLIQEKVTGKHQREKNIPGSTNKDQVPL